ncbi:hypothetical protein E1B28_007718 [Marasmius oreades]|uniref:Uncharacterized protein n=1 Tax=Marasmius oreades TaxID=181124 RepID=A0A9P7S3M2_9AGAR|nr:uncharacterized protein E1B28_007718 [Marasmius oreades]KAG7094101.1 hypothetical protein E1B28_007718 [Marasmius oreades]
MSLPLNLAQIALSDANRWFAGQEPSKTKFTREDSHWRRCVSLNDEDDGEDQQTDTYDPAWDRDEGQNSTSGAFIVCGIPGIGKSYFLYYLLVERLLRRLPTCFHNVWFLVDSNEQNISLAAISASGARLIQAASPGRARLRWIEKQNAFAYVWLMKPSSTRELLIMSQFWPDSKFVTKEEVKTFATAYGPSIHFIHRYARELDRYRSKLQSLIQQFTLGELRKLILRTQDLDVDEQGISHWILGIYPGDERNQITLGFHTSKVFDLVKAAFSESWNSYAPQIYVRLNRVGQTRGSAGLLLEDILHRDLPMGGYWKATQLESKNQRIEDTIFTTTSPGDPRTERYLVVGPNTDIVEAAPKRSSRPQPLASHRYEIEEAHSGIANVSWYNLGYYIPFSCNQATSFNSFIVNPQLRSVYVLQFTVSKEHQVNKEGLEFLLEHYSGYNLYYVLFGVREDVKLVVPRGFDGKWVSLWYVHATEDALLKQQTEATGTPKSGVVRG